MEGETLSIEDGTLSITPQLLEKHYHEGMVNEELDLTNTWVDLHKTGKQHYVRIFEVTPWENQCLFLRLSKGLEFNWP